MIGFRPVTIFHPFNPLIRPECQLETWRAIKTFKLLYPNRVCLIDIACYSDYDYSKYLMASFSSSVTDLIIIEQDIAPTYPQFLQMINCRVEFTISDYRIGSDNKRWSEIIDKRDAHYPLGFAMIRRSLYKDIKLGVCDWKNVAYEVSQAIDKLGVKPCIHSEVIHNHPYQ